MYNVHCTLYNVQCTYLFDNIHCTLYFLHCALCNVECILSNIINIMYILYLNHVICRYKYVL